jgi:hypothetical protein
MVSSARRWTALLERMACTSFKAPTPAEIGGGGHVFRAFSDAAQEGDQVGLGGFSAGYWWGGEFRYGERRVIASLEFLALVINLVLAAMLSQVGSVEVHVDNM